MTAFWALTGLACLLLVTAAAAHNQKADQVHLTMWWWGETEAKNASKWLSQTIKLYEQKHANITMSTVLQPTDSLVPAFKAAAAAKKGPDIQYFWGGTNIKAVSDFIPKSELRHYLN